jgi:hypothetical protein
MLRVARVSLLVISVSILTSVLLFAEADEARMKRLYRVAPDGAFIIEPGVSAKVTFDKRGGACTFTLFGEISEGKVLETFNVLVPVDQRGSTKPEESLQCVGSCIRTIFYKNVDLATGSFGKARSDPAAIISFKRSDCKAAVSEAHKQVWHMNRDEQAVQTERNQPTPR